MQFKEIEFLLNLLPSKNNDRNKNSRGKNGTPLQYFCLEDPMDGGAWWATVHGVAKSQTQLTDFTFTFHFHALEKEMATHSSVLAWRNPGTGKPGGLPSMGSHRVGHDWSNLQQQGEKKKKKLAQLLQTTCICIYQCSLKSNSTHPKTSNSSCMIAFIYSLTSICWTLINTM